MADRNDPWSDDLAALGDRTRSQLRSLAATRAHVLSTLPNQETPKMRLFKQRPVLSALVALAVLAVAAPIAYAIGSRVLLSIDADKSAPEIEQDIKNQLQAAGVSATVQTEKLDDGKLKMKIQSTDPSLGSGLEIQVHTSGSAQDFMHAVRVEMGCQLTDAQQQQLQAALTDSSVLDLLTDPGDLTDQERAAAITAALAKLDFHDVQVTVQGVDVTVKVTAPPHA